MIKHPVDAAAWLWVVLALVAFVMMVVAFTRLIVRAWKMPNRWKAIWKVANIQPRRNQEWPNAEPEAIWILIGAAVGVLLFSTAFVYLFIIRR